jgi:preprotein translocase subunit SecA
MKMLEDSIGEAVDFFLPTSSTKNTWDFSGLRTKYLSYISLPDDSTLGNLNPDEIKIMLYERGVAIYIARETELGGELMRSLERMIFLRSIDTHWIEHIIAMDILQKSIGLHTDKHLDPLVIYQEESNEMFGEMINKIYEDTVKYMLTLRVRTISSNAQADETSEDEEEDEEEIEEEIEEEPH